MEGLKKNFSIKLSIEFDRFECVFSGDELFSCKDFSFADKFSLLLLCDGLYL